MALLGAAVLNAVVLRQARRWRLSAIGSDADAPGSWRVSALASIVLWLGVIAMGRLIGYR
jgi:hypothetical protein